MHLPQKKVQGMIVDSVQMYLKVTILPEAAELLYNLAWSCFHARHSHGTPYNPEYLQELVNIRHALLWITGEITIGGIK